MCACFSKSEDETSEAMKQPENEAVTTSKSKFEQMKAIARAYATKREFSVQEAVYHIMPVKETPPRVMFSNSNLPENRYKLYALKRK